MADIFEKSSTGAIKRLLLSKRKITKVQPEAADFDVFAFYRRPNVLLTGNHYFKGVTCKELASIIDELNATGEIEGNQVYCTRDILRAASFINGRQRGVKVGDSQGGVLILSPFEEGLSSTNDNTWPHDYKFNKAQVLGFLRIKITAVQHPHSG